MFFENQPNRLKLHTDEISMEAFYAKRLSQLLLTTFYGHTKQRAFFFDLLKLSGNPFMKSLQIRLREHGLEKIEFPTYHKPSMRQYFEVSNYPGS